MEDTKKPNSLKMSESEMLKQVSEFSKGLTLWGSNRVVKKWLKYRKASQTQPSTENLILLEDIIYEIRRDVGQRKKLKKVICYLSLLMTLKLLLTANNKEQ